MPRIVIIGGGAAGYFGAINSALRRPDVEHILLEATPRPLTKVKISGGGRCNVTHNQFDPRELCKAYPRGHKELLGVFSRFQPRDTIAWFAERGVDLKAEADGRMFPTTNRSDTIIACLDNELQRAGVVLRKPAMVRSVTKTSTGFAIGLQGNPEPLAADAILLATGSSPLGHRIAGQLGHTITPLAPSLFTFEVSDPLLANQMGQVSPAAHLLLNVGGARFKQNGPMLITHWGLSGPAVLKLSAFAARELFASNYQAALHVNWTGLAAVDVDAVLRAQERGYVATSPLFHLSKKLWQALTSAFPQRWNELSANARKDLVTVLTDTIFTVTGKGVFKEEFVTCGGIDRKEVDFRTMQSKICPGLFFAGEILDIDGITGGFNFQNAWSTAFIAAQHLS